MSKEVYTNIIQPPQKQTEKMQAFKELVASRKEVKNYLSDEFDSEAELETARKDNIAKLGL